MTKLVLSNPFHKAIAFITLYSKSITNEKLGRRNKSSFIRNVIDAAGFKTSEFMHTFSSDDGNSCVFVVYKDDKNDKDFNVIHLKNYRDTNSTLILVPDAETLDDMSEDELLRKFDSLFFKLLEESDLGYREDFGVYIDKFIYIWARYFFMCLLISEIYSISDNFRQHIADYLSKTGIVNIDDVNDEIINSDSYIDTTNRLFCDYEVLKYCHAKDIEEIRDSFN